MTCTSKIGIVQIAYAQRITCPFATIRISVPLPLLLTREQVLPFERWIDFSRAENFGQEVGLLLVGKAFEGSQLRVD
ncbi:hypothetical protein CEXT_584611 [Caerostris extrusa]|uniref:Uncharacterized protein n=1 Tax=Caerostris extrusa TaxID=172846 RepID=A0AAV4U708_CAEEX|nr:hypothetical protein CEXT_584611 [Caerostris extrusa]